MHRGAWCATVHGVAKSRTRLSNTFTFSLSLFLDVKNKGKGVKAHYRLNGYIAVLILFIKMGESVEEETGFKGKIFNGPVFGHEYKTLSGDVMQAQVQHAPRREVRPVGPTCRAERKGGEAQGS